MKISFDQIIAAVVIVGGMALRCFGVDGEVWALVLLAGGFIFGSGYQERKLRARLNELEKALEQVREKGSQE
jgi:hypothetical protein